MIPVPEPADMELLHILRYIDRGPVPPRLRDRIATADVASLHAWFDRAVDTSDLNSVFESSEVA